MPRLVLRVQNRSAVSGRDYRELETLVRLVPLLVLEVVAFLPMGLLFKCAVRYEVQLAEVRLGGQFGEVLPEDPSVSAESLAMGHHVMDSGIARCPAVRGEVSQTSR